MYTYVMFHKPRGCVTACRDATHKTVMDYFPPELQHLRPVGRLDRDTEGFLLLTDDGMFNYRLMQPEFHVPKTYFFYAFGILTPEGLARLAAGERLHGNGIQARPADGKILAYTNVAAVQAYLDPARVEHYLHHPEGNITAGQLCITEGKKHEVKLLLKTVGCTVCYLKRIAIGGLPLDEALAPGSYRLLCDEELQQMLPANTAYTPLAP